MNILALLEIEHEEYVIDLLNGEQTSEWYKKINPKMKIPAIKDGDHCMGESIDICKYLVETRKLKTPAWPVDDQEKIDQMERDLAKVDELASASGNVSYNCFYNQFAGKKLAGKELKKKVLNELYLVYDRFEETLAERKTKFYNSDDHPGLQDYLTYNFIKYLTSIKLSSLAGYPVLMQWFNDCEKVPSIAVVSTRLEKETASLLFKIRWINPLKRFLTCRCCCRR
ncbi:unnamed protein product [Moneuplotes crassus]|uniref:Glutathione S-transferase n=1 Tax=Euplotes crassus TaxID=5936 RepID=A0AAD1XRN8_EUPCR|nr:unnamed protein product [Moneuplotes crassus]